MTIEARLEEYKKKIRHSKDPQSRRILLEKMQALRATIRAINNQDK